MLFTDPRTDQETKGWFRGRCFGETYDRHGKRVYGPAPRDLDRFPVNVGVDSVEVDTTRLICGAAVLDWNPAGCDRAPPPE